ncbi:MAG: carbohydrate porin, partial [Verrucomicrobiales bacterium]
GHQSNEILGGRNLAVLQYGVGAAANFRSTSEDFSFLNAPLAPAAPLRVDLGDAWHFRFVDDLVIEPSPSLSLQATFVWDEFDDGLQGGDSRSSWQSVGIRPEWNLTDHFSIAFEAGMDNVSVLDYPSGQLYKFTVAPQLKAGRGYFDRPVLRAFATYATWSEELEGYVAPRTNSDDNSGFSFGVQVESWW